MEQFPSSLFATMSNVEGSKNDRAWERLFTTHTLLERLREAPCIEISATEINAVREARLMTKFDHTTQLPELFRAHHLAILPTSRGTYTIGRFLAYQRFDTSRIPILHIKPTLSLESLRPELVSNESSAILLALHLGIFKHFTGDTTPFYASVGGRMGTGRFAFEIATRSEPLRLQVENAQVEIDAGYESAQALYLIEAKNHLADDFIVRQLYYPYRLWQARVKKPVRLIYLTYSDGTFHLREYRFLAPEVYSSIALVRSQRYRIDDEAFSLSSLRSLLASTPVEAEPHLPFPQADSFERLINLCEILYSQAPIDKPSITQRYGFVTRQTDYYLAAGRYLGLIEEVGIGRSGRFRLTQRGQWIFSQPLYGRHIALLEKLFVHPPFRAVCEAYLAGEGKPLATEQVMALVAPWLPRLSESTLRRRAATVVAWLGWLRYDLEGAVL